MSLVTANGLPVTGGTIEMPLEGVWIADITVDNPGGGGFAAGTSVTIAAAQGIELRGTIAPARSGEFLDSTHMRVLGGAAGMARPASPRGFSQPGAYVRDVLRALADDAGETLADDTARALLDKNLVSWAIHSGMVSSALRVLLELIAPTMRWRITPDGKLWIGEETWPQTSAEFFILEQDASSATAYLRAQSPSIYPGYEIPGVGRASRVEHEILPEYVRTRVWTDIPDDNRGIAASVAVMVEQATGRFDYYATYRYKIQNQSADLNTVDVAPIAPNDVRLPGLNGVPVREGSAVKFQFTQGAEVLLGWDGGDPERPYVTSGLASDPVQRIQLAGNTDAARKGDAISLGACHVIVNSSGAVTQVWINGAQLPVATPTSVDRGTITGGSTKVGLG